MVLKTRNKNLSFNRSKYVFWWQLNTAHPCVSKLPTYYLIICELKLQHTRVRSKGCSQNGYIWLSMHWAGRSLASAASHLFWQFPGTNTLSLTPIFGNDTPQAFKNPSDIQLKFTSIFVSPSGRWGGVESKPQKLRVSYCHLLLSDAQKSLYCKTLKGIWSQELEKKNPNITQQQNLKGLAMLTTT